MTRRLGRIALLPLLAFVAASSAAAKPSSVATRVATPAERAIVQFSGSPSRVDRSFHALHTHYLGQRSALRRAALTHLGDRRSDVHYASLYALALTADGGSAATALRGLLSSKHIDERMLAASALARIGDKAGIPILIEGLSVRRQLAYRDPPEQAWELARHALLTYTTQDFGLRHAASASAAARVQPAWRRWWKARGPSLRWKPSVRRLSSVSNPGEGVTPAAATALAAKPGTQWKIDGSEVTITVPIDLVGPSIVHDANGRAVELSKHARTLLENAAKIWNDALKRVRYSRNCGGLRGQPWRIRLELDLMLRSSGYHSTSNRHMVIFVDDPKVRSSFNGVGGEHTDDRADVYGRALEGHWSSHDGEREAAHELAHLLGLGNDYDDEIVDGKTRSVPIERDGSDRTGTLMAQVTGRIDHQLIARLGHLIEQASGKKPTCRPVGVVTYTRKAILTEEFNKASVELSVEGRSGPYDADVTTTIRYEGTLTCASPGPCSSCPGVVLTETIEGSAKRTPVSSFRVVLLADRVSELELVPGATAVLRKKDEFTGIGCATRTVETSESWTIIPPRASEIGGTGRSLGGMSGSVSRSPVAPPGGHVCSLIPNHGQAFTTCQETVDWDVS